jgi:ElaB/YqjD/DUF883 family membrane-anchored ribosome-binding protein
MKLLISIGVFLLVILGVYCVSKSSKDTSGNKIEEINEEIDKIKDKNSGSNLDDKTDAVAKETGKLIYETKNRIKEKSDKVVAEVKDFSEKTSNEIKHLETEAEKEKTEKEKETKRE